MNNASLTSSDSFAARAQRSEARRVVIWLIVLVGMLVLTLTRRSFGGVVMGRKPAIRPLPRRDPRRHRVPGHPALIPAPRQPRRTSHARLALAGQRDVRPCSPRSAADHRRVPFAARRG